MTVPSTGVDPSNTYSGEYLTFEALEDGRFQFTNSIQYSLDGGTTWVNLAANTPSPLINSGNKICWAYTVPSSTDASYRIGTFSSTRRFNVEGNIMSMAYGSNFIGKTSLENKISVFCQLFNNCTTLISAENLILPATTISQNCYGHMFNGCYSLTKSPYIIPAMTAAVDCCQFMFKNCSNLINAPQLPATTLSSGCYQYMFSGCYSLITAPQLPAPILVGHCYQQMFGGCSNLNYIKCLATDISAVDCTSGWVSGVSASGIFKKSSSMTSWSTGNNGIPSGWTVVT